MTPSKIPSIKINITANEVFKCDVPGCTSQRHRVAKYCYRHWIQYRKWGHPEATSIPQREYKSQTDEVTRLLDANPEHKGIQFGLTFIARWISSAVTMQAGPCPERVSKFQGVISPRDILIELAAVYVFAQENMGTRVKHELHLRHLIGLKFLCIGSRVRELWEPNGRRVEKVTGKQAREAGRIILVEIGELLRNIFKAVIERREVLVQKAEVQKQSFA